MVPIMRLLARVGSPHAVVTVVTAITALYMVLVVFGNVTDYGTNRAFVEHVLAMDTTFKSPNTMWRAITSSGVVTVAYVLIIVWEALTALVLVAGFVAWLRVLFGGRDAAQARLLSSAGLVMQLLLFGGGFIAIGGEWFQMWQSQTWNGLQAALQNFVIGGISLILVHVAGRDAK
jgi:predicted small integral membrane protein